MPCWSRPVVVLGVPLLLSGCAGFGVFLDTTHGAAQHQNRPIGNSETVRRVEGQPVATEPLVATPGNVWPGPVPPEPTLQDLAHVAPPVLEGATPPPLANVPGLQIPTIPHHIQPRPGEDGAVLNGPIQGGPPILAEPPPVPPRLIQPNPTQPTRPGASPQGQVTPTPRGPSVSTRVPSGIPQANVPSNGGGIVVPNGDGTSTVIAPDGTVTTIPTPRR